MHANRKTVVLLIISFSIDKYIFVEKYICMDKNWCLHISLDRLSNWY
jgi:hypothetical protein